MHGPGMGQLDQRSGEPAPDVLSFGFFSNVEDAVA
jgi:hypothetical protein